MDDDLTETETLGNVIKFMEHVLKNGTFQEIRQLNVHVSSQVMKVEDIMRKYWPDIVASEIVADTKITKE
jgi:hypothetical protein